MKRKVNIIFYIIIPVIFFLGLNGFGAKEDTIRRFAIVAGANDGGPDRVRLKYSVSDAKSVAKVLSEMGGLLPDDTLLLIEPDRKSFLLGIEDITERVKRAKDSHERSEVIFYYSGHSDEESILLGREKVYYKEIKDHINAIPSDVRIAILDSCSSGAFTRLKGGRMRSPFMVDSAYNMKGYVFMTSSSQDEASQESDRIKGSFFTYYLVSGLRGAADMSQDGRITLDEAYQFAYNETLAGTEKTISGPQHPNKIIQMSGAGGVVMTDIRKSSSVLILDKDISGRLFIRDGEDNLVCELRKPAGRELQFGLENGKYNILNIKDGNLYETELLLMDGEQRLISQDNFSKTSKDITIARGEVETSENGYEEIDWEFSLYPMFERNKNVLNHYQFNLFGSYSAKLDGVAMGIGPSIVREDVKGFQVTVAGNYAGKEVEGAQISVIGNISGADVNGLQMSNIFNYAKGDTKGAQLADIFNMTRKNFKGFQGSSVFNYVSENFTGAQLAGVFNYTGGDAKGAQISGIFNYAGEYMKGLQLSGITNISGDAKAAQISCVNIAEDFNGVQLGLVNIAKTQNGIPIGLINVSENGSIDIALWGSSLMAGNAGIVFRANYIYTMFSAGWMNLEHNIDRSFAYGFHIGGHVPLGQFYAELDIGNIIIDNEKLFSGKEEIDSNVYQGRLSIGYYITESISIFAGGGINYIFDTILYSSDGKYDVRNGSFSPTYFAGVKASIYGKG